MSHEFYVFGSVARGDATATSDVDILVIPRDENCSRDYPPTWSVYQRQTVLDYYKMGRLFAWHLYLESRCLFTPLPTPWLSSLGEPSSYQTARQDVEQLWMLLNGSLDEIRSGTDSLVYELGIAYTAIRDVAMSASWRWLGRPAFSRDAPYQLPIECPLRFGTYQVAMAARHASTRGADIPREIEQAAEALMAAPLNAWIKQLLQGL